MIISLVTKHLNKTGVKVIMVHQTITGWFNFEKVYSDEIEKANDGDNFLEIGC